MSDPMDKKVDDDWKRRAQMEKAQLDAQERGRRPAKAEDEAGAEPAEAESLFVSFIANLGAQAAMCLGLEPDPMTGARRVNIEQARYLIDVLGMFEGKTRGNLAPEEERQLKLIVQELRMAYVELTSRPRGGGPAGPRGPGGMPPGPRV